MQVFGVQSERIGHGTGEARTAARVYTSVVRRMPARASCMRSTCISVIVVDESRQHSSGEGDT